MKKFIVYTAFLLLLAGCAAKKKSAEVPRLYPVPISCVTIIGVAQDAPPCRPAKMKDGRMVQLCNKVILESHCAVVTKSPAK